MKPAFQVLLAVLIPLASFTTGLGARMSERKRLWRRPMTLLRALLAILILVPLWTLALIQILPLAPFARAGLLVAVLAVGIGPIAGMRRMRGPTPEASDALDLNLVVLAVGLLFVPAAFAALTAAFHRDLHLGMWKVAEVVLGRALVPLVLGLGVARLVPRIARAAAPVLAKLVTAVALLVLVAALIATRRALANVGGAAWLAAFAVAVGALAIGHLLGGPDPATRAAVAAESVLRFPALALVLASASPQSKRLVPIVVVYVVAATVVTTIYGAFRAGIVRRGTLQPTPTPAEVTP